MTYVRSKPAWDSNDACGWLPSTPSQERSFVTNRIPAQVDIVLDGEDKQLRGRRTTVAVASPYISDEVSPVNEICASDAHDN
ncbi:hypothetical protein PF010_g8500 [Phytophthora fragariae]|uniref:Uncharacterized protein n=1 Tax=Phytophthora fragariae TaxID=53985 RepID=A0A6G0P3K2_9STRA|nr:hypothetical protein PF010_g8500 [Phytophthora fragariae]KAE9233490.1 hypothetical protein PF004_g9646 [Phytophthora fragariae]